MENKRRRLMWTTFGTACFWSCVAVATPDVSDRPQIVTIRYDNGDQLDVRCDSSDRCEFDVKVFGRKFHLVKDDIKISDPIIPNRLVLTPLSDEGSTYYINVSTFCGKDDFRKWGKAHFELNCYALLQAKGDKVVSLERIVEQSNMVSWEKAKLLE